MLKNLTLGDLKLEEFDVSIFVMLEDAPKPQRIDCCYHNSKPSKQRKEKYVEQYPKLGNNYTIISR